MTPEQKQAAIEALKQKGKELGEKEVELLVNEAFDTLDVVLPLCNAQASAIVLPLLKFVKPMIMQQVDKIDGKVDQQ